MQKTIVVIGGTGTLGQPVAHRLNEAGFRVRIMTRDHQKAREMFDDAFEIIAGDTLDTGCLEEALHGCYGVHISLASEVEQPAAEAVAQVAAKHGVQRITYVSGATVAEATRWFSMADRKFRAEQAIRAAGIPFTIVCPTWVMEVLPKFVRQGRATVLGQQPFPYHWVAADDIARLVSMAYGHEDAGDQRLIVHGPEAITMEAALRRYCARFHPEITAVSRMPLWLAKLLATITGNHELKGASEMMAYFERVGEGHGPVTPDGRVEGSTTLDTWLESRYLQTHSQM